MNKQKIKAMLKGSSIVRRLIKGKNEINDAMGVQFYGHNELSMPLKEIVLKCEANILFYKKKIAEIFASMDGFDPSIHITLDYISMNDIETGYIDITKDDEGIYFLDLRSGEIVFIEPTEVKSSRR